MQGSICVHVCTCQFIHTHLFMCKNAHVDAQVRVEKSAYTHKEICSVYGHAGASVHLSQGLECGHTKREKVNGVDLPELWLSWVNTLRLQILAKGNN